MKKKGFTLVELMIVMAVIAILAMLALVGFRTAQRTARNTEREQMARGVQVALECYFGDEGTYPPVADVTLGNLPGTFPNCWSGATQPEDPLSGDFCDAGEAYTTCTYSQTAADDYTLTITGEGLREFTFLSPT